MMMNRPLQRFALAAALVAVSGHCFAQFGGGGGMGGGRRGTRPDSTTSPRTGDGLSTPATASGKLYDLRVQLMITPEQSQLWDRFSDAVWDMASRAGMTAAAPPDDLTALQFAQQRAMQAQDRARRTQAVSDALSKLYEAMTPEQRHTADQNLPAVIP